MIKIADRPTAPVVEIFSSYQGEGICAGMPQIFVRFAGCNLACRYCDTPASRKKSAGKTLGVAAAARRIALLSRASRPRPEMVSLTGGEPLLHADFIAALAPSVRKSGLGIYLETNGTLPRALAKTIDAVNVVAMDIKPKTAAGKNLGKTQKTFARIAGKKLFLKLVIDGRTRLADVAAALRLSRNLGPRPPLVVQPATPSRSVRACRPEIFRRILRLAAAAKHPPVFVIPQMHKIYWGVK